MPNHKYAGHQVFKCISVLDPNCGTFGILNTKINNLQQTTNEQGDSINSLQQTVSQNVIDIVSLTKQITYLTPYIISVSFDVGGISADTYHYPTKDNNDLGDTYNINNFEKGNFIKHIYTATLSDNIKKIIIEYDLYAEEEHNVTIELCEVKHEPYTGTETDDLPLIHSKQLNSIVDNMKNKFEFPITITNNKTVTVRMKFQDPIGHGNNKVTMACTLYGTTE